MGKWLLNTAIPQFSDDFFYFACANLRVRKNKQTAKQWKDRERENSKRLHNGQTIPSEIIIFVYIAKADQACLPVRITFSSS